jgi:hypothetical protein
MRILELFQQFALRRSGDKDGAWATHCIISIAGQIDRPRLRLRTIVTSILELHHALPIGIG